MPQSCSSSAIFGWICQATYTSNSKCQCISVNVIQSHQDKSMSRSVGVMEFRSSVTEWCLLVDQVLRDRISLLSCQICANWFSTGLHLVCVKHIYVPKTGTCQTYFVMCQNLVCFKIILVHLLALGAFKVVIQLNGGGEWLMIISVCVELILVRVKSGMCQTYLFWYICSPWDLSLVIQLNGGGKRLMIILVCVKDWMSQTYFGTCLNLVHVKLIWYVSKLLWYVSKSGMCQNYFGFCSDGNKLLISAYLQGCYTLN